MVIISDEQVLTKLVFAYHFQHGTILYRPNICNCYIGKSILYVHIVAMSMYKLKFQTWLKLGHCNSLVRSANQNAHELASSILIWGLKKQNSVRSICLTKTRFSQWHWEQRKLLSDKILLFPEKGQRWLPTERNPFLCPERIARKKLISSNVHEFQLSQTTWSINHEV